MILSEAANSNYDDFKNNVNYLINGNDQESLKNLRTYLQECRNNEFSNFKNKVISFLKDCHQVRNTKKFKKFLGILVEQGILDRPKAEKCFSKIDDDNDLICLTPTAVKIILDNIQAQKGYFNEVSYDSCRSLEEGQKKIVNFLKDPSLNRFCLALGHCMESKGITSYHFTPIYIEKNKGKEKEHYRVVITDSRGLESYYSDQALYVLLKASMTMGISQDQFSIFVANRSRQTDLTNCAIFVIRDMVHLAQNSAEYLNFIEKQIDEPNLDFFTDMGLHASLDYSLFEYLPPAMMKVTQSLTKICLYDANVKIDTKNECDKVGEIEEFEDSDNQAKRDYQEENISGLKTVILKGDEPEDIDFLAAETNNNVEEQLRAANKILKVESDYEINVKVELLFRKYQLFLIKNEDLII
jgi:hypothetical protein